MLIKNSSTLIEIQHENNIRKSIDDSGGPRDRTAKNRRNWESDIHKPRTALESRNIRASNSGADRDNGQLEKVMHILRQQPNNE